MQRPMPRYRKKRIRFFHIYFLSLTLILALALTGLLAQTAFAKTYVITDGDQIVTCTTFATDPARVLGQAGVRLNRFDTYTTAEGENVQTITICRAGEVTVHYHGQIIKTTAQNETTGELLSRLGLAVDGEDVLSRDWNEPVRDGMEIRVDRVVTAEETYTTAIPFETVLQNDAQKSGVLTPGADGEMLCTALVTYVNGEETQRQVLSRQVTQAPTPQTVGVGAGEEAEAAQSGAPVFGDGYIILPSGELLTYTRKDTVRATAYTHTDRGCDLVTATGTTVHRGTVAVDPRYIPYGTRMYIVASDGSFVYGLAQAEDCGGDIKGDRMDLYLPTFQECIEFGRRPCTVYFLG